MNHCVGCWWHSCHDVAPLGYFERSSKHSKREAFWRYVLFPLQNCCVNDSLRQLILAQLTHLNSFSHFLTKRFQK
jgi:hypothetical protein